MSELTDFLILPVQQKIFSFTTGLTAAEFLTTTPALTQLLRQRLAEIRVPTPVQEYFITYPDNLNFALLISEDAPETAIILPLWVRIAQLSSKFSLRIFRDTDNLNLLNRLMEEVDLSEDIGEMELPICYIFDEEWDYQTQWGPHPQAAEPFLDKWFEQHSEYETLAEEETPEAQQAYARLIHILIQQMRVWYNSGLDRACLHEVRDLLASLHDEDEGEISSRQEP